MIKSIIDPFKLYWIWPHPDQNYYILILKGWLYFWISISSILQHNTPGCEDNLLHSTVLRIIGLTISKNLQEASEVVCKQSQKKLNKFSKILCTRHSSKMSQEVCLYRNDVFGYWGSFNLKDFVHVRLLV